MENTFDEYVDVISSASLDLFPSNTGSHFTNKLVVPQFLPENTYVGLSEISYNSCFYNIIKSETSISIFDWLHENKKTVENEETGATEIIKTYGELYRQLPIEEGYYDEAEKVCSMLNKVIRSSGVEQLKTHDVFIYNPISRKFSYNLENLWLSLFISGSLVHLLGVERKQALPGDTIILGLPKTEPTYIYNKETRTLIHKDWHWEAEIKLKDTMSHVCQLVMVQTMCIYTNIIQSQKTGDKYSDLLRLVSIKEEKFGRQVVEHFDQPYYLKLNARYIPSITISIRDLFGYSIQFLSGIVSVKLKFIRKPE